MGEFESRYGTGNLSRADRYPVCSLPHCSFLPGSIVRVALKNFVTYDSVEFHPGPHLNMIIGPNGTGKSTIVCAIALGLGWKPAVLGRAKDVASFVKQGYEDGWIEIELKGKRDEPNLVVKRLISKKNNASDWKLNGEKATAKTVGEAVNAFDVSIDNLCCFLPQDKVADFARMDPPRLLVETQRAAGHPNLSHWHEQLGTLGEGYRKAKADLARDQEEQNNLEQRNEVLGRDVERYEQRRRIEEEIALLSLDLPFAEYREAKEWWAELKDLKNERKAELDALKKANEPLERRVGDMKDKLQKIQLHKGKCADAVNKTSRDLRDIVNKIERYESDTTDLQDKLENIKKTEEDQQKLVRHLKQQVSELEARIRQEPAQADTTRLEEQIREIRQSVRQIQGQCHDIKADMEEIGAESHRAQKIKDDTLVRLKKLDDVRANRMQYLRQADPDAAKAVDWLSKNKHVFRGKVYEPVMLEVTVKDGRYTAHVESCINWIIMRTFVCETRADYDYFTSECIDKHRLRINVAEVEGGKSTAEFEAARPLSVEQIRAMGFNDYISSFLDAPETVLAYLYTTANLHTIPVAVGDTINAEAVEQARHIKRYIAGRSNHTITWSEYGSRLPTTMSRDLNTPRTLGQTTNQAEKGPLEQTMQDIARQLKENEQKMGVLQDKLKEREEELKEYQAKKADVEEQKAEANQARQEWEKSKINLAAKKKRLHEELSRPSIEAQRNKLNKEIIKKTEQRFELARSMKKILGKQMEHRAEQDNWVLSEVQHHVNFAAWKELLQSKAKDYASAEGALNDAVRDWQKAKEKAMQLQKTAQDKFNNCEEEFQTKWRTRQDEMAASGREPTAAECETMLTTQQGQLELAAGVAPGVVEAFKKRAAKIRSLQEDIVQKTREVARAEIKIDKIKKQWYPALQALVNRVSEKFSAAFDRIGCAGEVKISEKENDHYEQWGLDILVKFRDSEQLHLLTGQRQSGGERALSTILFLMSLTELSRSPFSLVDEINQGMDQRAERAVHDQMVEVTCRPTASQ